jgi:hypothetical protein
MDVTLVGGEEPLHNHGLVLKRHLHELIGQLSPFRYKLRNGSAQSIGDQMVRLAADQRYANDQNNLAMIQRSRRAAELRRGDKVA